jgi:hypothetical protein
VRTALLFIVVGLCLRGADLPKTLLSEDEAEPIHSAITRKEAWTLDAVRRLRAEADRRVREGPWTVTADRPRDVNVDMHEYYSEAPYWWPNPENPDGPYVRQDGQVNPSRFLANEKALNAMADAVFTLGTAAYLLEDTRYAQRAARDIQAWFINPKTRMNPSLEYAQSIPGVNDGHPSGILDGRVLIRAIQGMEFLSQTGQWDSKDEAAVRRWFEEYLRWLTTGRKGEEEQRSGNSHAAWWTAQVAAVSTFVSNQAAAQLAFQYYRDHIFPRQIRRDGATKEDLRARALSYTAFNLEASTLICRIAQVQGVDLWSLKTRNVATLATAIDFLVPYLADPKKWAREQGSDFPSDGTYFLAFAGMGLKRPEYVALFRKLERPEGAWVSLIDLIVGRWENAAHQTRH